MNIFYIKRADSEFVPFKLKFEFETIKDYDTFMGILSDAELQIGKRRSSVNHYPMRNSDNERCELIDHIKDVINLKIEK
jgi:hypothetical protein